MTLLCGACHDRVTRGLLAKETIKFKMQNPKCKELGFSFGPFDIGLRPPEIVLGTIKARNAKTLLRICGDDVLTIAAPFEPGLPFNFNAQFFDTTGTPILHIVENEWRSSSGNWDVEIIGNRISVRKALGDLALVLRSEPPGRLIVERMNMLHRGIRMVCREGSAFEIVSPDGSTIRGGALEGENWEIGIDADASGIRIGRGGSTYIGHAEFNGGGLDSRYVAAQRRSQPLSHNAIPRNAPCPCGSGRKFKKCHGAIL
jgi:hypothetical protein